MRKMSSEQLYKVAKASQISGIIFLIVSFTGSAIRTATTDDKLSGFWLYFYLTFLVVCFIGVLFNQKLWTAVHNILWEQVDLDGYYSFFARFLKEKRKGGLKFYWGLVEYFRGHFEIAKVSLSKLTAQDFLPRGRKAAVNQVYVFRLLSAIGRGDDAAFERISDEAIAYDVHHERKVEKLRVYKAVAEGNVVDDVPLLNEKPLNHILHTYYCAKNALNAGDTDHAREYFEAIKDENPDLYMVREAREYLEYPGKSCLLVKEP